MKQALSPKTLDLIAFIVAYQAEHGCAPTRREMSNAMDLPSIAAVDHYTLMLERAGLVCRKGGPRGLVVTAAGNLTLGTENPGNSPDESDATLRFRLSRACAAVEAYEALRREYEVLQLNPLAHPERARMIGRMRDARDRMFNVVAEVKV